MDFLFKRFNNNLRFEGFDCGEDTLNHFLDYSCDYYNRGISCSHFLIKEDILVGFYTISPSCISKKEAERLEFDIPFPLPCWLIGQLAIDKKFQKQGLGEKLLFRALKDILHRAQHGAGAVIYLDALNNDVVKFYKKIGFKSFGNGTRKMFFLIEEAKKLCSYEDHS